MFLLRVRASLLKVFATLIFALARLQSTFAFDGDDFPSPGLFLPVLFPEEEEAEAALAFLLASRMASGMLH